MDDEDDDGLDEEEGLTEARQASNSNYLDVSFAAPYRIDFRTLNLPAGLPQRGLSARARICLKKVDSDFLCSVANSLLSLQELQLQQQPALPVLVFYYVACCCDGKAHLLRSQRLR